MQRMQPKGCCLISVRARLAGRVVAAAVAAAGAERFWGTMPLGVVIADMVSAGRRAQGAGRNRCGAVQCEWIV